ncbi:MAG: hypothetical protein LV471_09165 [Nitrosomonas sp.]|nr:hypothetical protein [Nitrosomonas sp.]
MSSGKYWAGVLPVNTDQDTGAVPAGKVRTVSVNLVNTNTSQSAIVKVYISTGTSPVDADRIEPDITIPASGLYKLTGEIVGAGERVILRSNISSVTARVTGFEENV